MKNPLCLKPEDWPPADRTLWEAVRQPAGFLEKARPASVWSASRRRIVEQAYGQWLSWLAQRGWLDDKPPQSRVTPERMLGFIRNLQERVSPCSVAMMAGAVLRMLAVLAPAENWTWLSGMVSTLKRQARPGRNRFAHIVPPHELYDLGVRLMMEARAERLDGTCRSAMKGRDGLMIAVLICCPVRISNLEQIGIGQNLVFHEDRHLLKFADDETKTGIGLKQELPPELSPWIEEYLQTHRPALLACGPGIITGRLWIDRWGHPMRQHSIRAQIKKRTMEAFGKPIWPHLFRACGATGLVDRSPEDIGIAADLLGHTNDRTTRKYYILATGMQAHAAVQQSFLRGRAEALDRLKGGPRCEK